MFFKKLFTGKRSVSVVKNRLKQILSADRLAISPTLLERVQTALTDIFTSELGAGNMLFAISSKRSAGNTELTVNVSFAELEAPAA